MQEIAVIEGLETEILEGKVPLRVESCGKPCQVETRKLGIEELGFDAFL